MLISLRPSERLLAAVTENNAEDLLSAIADGADVDFRRTKNTPLMLALGRGNFKCAKILVAAGANMNLDNGFGWLPIHEVCLQGNIEWVDMILQNPMLISDRRDHDGATPLLVAIVAGHMEIASKLVGSRSNVNAQTTQGVSPFMLAVEKQNEELVRKMLSFNADALLKDATGRCAIDRAENWQAGSKLLGSSGAGVSKTSPTIPEIVGVVEKTEKTGVSVIQKRHRHA